MIRFSERFIQLRIEMGLSYKDFCEKFYDEFRYSVDDSICGDGLNLIDIGLLKDLCKFFDVSFNYLIGLSSERNSNGSVNPYDEIIALCSVVFTSDMYSADEKKEFYLKICRIFDMGN